jgi:hypothetical protein
MYHSQGDAIFLTSADIEVSKSAIMSKANLSKFHSEVKKLATYCRELPLSMVIHVIQTIPHN